MKKLVVISLSACFILFSSVYAASGAGGGALKKGKDSASQKAEAFSKNVDVEDLAGQLTALPDCVQIPPRIYVAGHNGVMKVLVHTIAAEAESAWNEAEKAWSEKRFDDAIAAYKKAATMDPEFSTIYCNLGDAYYGKGDMAGAKIYFEKAISVNFIDYQAHWFLADTLAALGDLKGAVREMTLAHVLNPCHAEIRRSLHGDRERSGRPFNDWTFIPQCRVTKNNGKILIEAKPDWVSYGLVRSIYLSQTQVGGRSMSITGPRGESTRLITEIDSIKALDTAKPEFKLIGKIIKAGYLEEFIYYEILTRAHPEEMLVLGEKKIRRIADYVDMFH